MGTELICPTCGHGPMVLVTPDWVMTGHRKRGVVRVGEGMKPIDEYGRCIACADEGRVPYKLTPHMTPEERAVLEAAEKWFKLNVMAGVPSEGTVKILEAKGVFVSAVDRAMAVAVARMLKAREPAPTVPAATAYNWYCRACGVVSKQTTAVPKEDRKCPCGAPCTVKARGGT